MSKQDVIEIEDAVLVLRDHGTDIGKVHGTQ